MNVTFTRTAERRYRVSVEGPAIEALSMEPAPGYDSRLPHDAAHFIVENELGIAGAIFGQLAAGGNAGGTFRSDTLAKPRKAKRRGEAMAKANRADALFSEHAVYASQSRWNRDAIIPDTKISPADIERICRKFDEFCSLWSKLPVGGAITLEWKHTGNIKLR
jgi:hypothetical protein